MANVTCVFDAKAQLGEAATWCDREQALYWADIDGKALHRHHPESGDNRRWSLPEELGCFALRESGGFVLAMRNGFYTFDPETGALNTITDPEADRPGSRFNDGWVDSAGRLWAGTMPMTHGDGGPEGVIYRLDLDLTCTAMIRGLFTSNGIAFAPDGRIMYFSDSYPAVQTIWACDYDPEAGSPTNRRVFHDAHALDGRPDGGTVDADGGYWMAGVGGWRLIRFTPGGKIDQVIEMPVEKPTKISFGGPDLDVLYVTSIGFDLTEGRAQPQAGGLFAVTGAGFRGLPTARFRG